MTRRDLLRKAAGVAIASVVPAAAAAPSLIPPICLQTWGPSKEFRELMEFLLREMAAGMGLPYEMIDRHVNKCLAPLSD